MRSNFLILLFLCIVAGGFQAKAQYEIKPAFKVIVTGSGGGIEEDNLNGYLLAGLNSNDFIMLDAGTLVSGIEKAVNSGSFYDVFVPPQIGINKKEYIFKHLIRAYLISHPHLDHVSGLAIGTPADTSNPVYASAYTIDEINNHLFNWEVWPNFANEGEGYALGTYTYQNLAPGQPQRIRGTAFEVTAFPVSHQEPYQSTAFLIGRYGEYVLYVGDTGPDEIEGKNHLLSLWLKIAPLIKENRLHAIFIECSYPSDRSDAELYGHLNPQWLTRELGRLAGEVEGLNPGKTINGLKVVVTGIKPNFDGDAGYLIHRQLLERNEYGVQYIIPEQGLRIEF